jgi:DNA-binding beta-propeller fold protein YncE
MRETLDKGHVLTMKTNAVKQAKKLISPYQTEFLEPCATADVEFLPPTDIISVCGQIFAPNLPDPLKCKLDAIFREPSMVGMECSANLHAINCKGAVCKGLIEQLECHLVSELSGTRLSCGIEKIKRGRQIEVTYRPTTKGRHQLHIKAQDQHIRGSPFSGIRVEAPVEKLGTPILTISGVVAPWGVAINRNREVVVTEWGSHRVSIFSCSGEKLQSFGSSGSGRGQVKYPCGVAVDVKGNILVADKQNHRIQKFTSKGCFITSVGTYGTGHLQFSCPTGITVNASNGMVYVSDSCNHRIQVLNSNLAFFSTFGKRGSSTGEFSYPHGIAYDRSGNLYVADLDNYRIQVFTHQGKFLRMFKQHRGKLWGPIGIAIDLSDMVYISEVDNKSISVFSSRGQFVKTFGREGEEQKEFVRRGLAVDIDRVVYVCDMDNNRVQVF